MNSPAGKIDSNTLDRFALVFGVGPIEGLGAALCRRFAQEGLNTIAVGRTEASLQKVVSAIEAEGGRAGYRVCDSTDEAQITALYEQMTAEKKSVVLTVYNTGNNMAVPSLEMTGAQFELLWKLCAYGGFVVGREAARHMLDHNLGGSIIFTGATASMKARPPFIGFAAAKAAERAVAHGFAREFGPLGIHVAHVIVDGIIGGDKVRENFPEFFEARGDDGVLNIQDMADAYWMLHSQPKTTWTLDLDLRPYKEPF